MVTKNSTTITMTGEEQTVQFDRNYSYFWVQNLGDSDVSISIDSGIVDGADGVITVPAGGSCGSMHGYPADKLYLIGSGKVQVMGTGSAFNPFKSSWKGGGSGGKINFSTDEQVAGTWIDGRTVYKKTIIFDAPSQSTSGKTVVYHNHDISDIDLIWFGGESFWSANNAQHTMSLTLGLGNDLTPMYTYFFSCAIDAAKITIQFGSSYSNVTVYATVMYVKNN